MSETGLPPLTVRAAARDVATAVLLGIAVSIVPVLLWLTLSPDTHAARWNPLAKRTAWRLRADIEGDQARRLQRDATAWLTDRQVAGEAHLVERDGRRWLELMGPSGESARKLGREVVAPAGAWDGTVELGGGRLDLLLRDARADGGGPRALAVLLAFALGGMGIAFLILGLRRARPLPDGWATRGPGAGRSLLWGLLGGVALLAGAYGLDALLRVIGMPQTEQPLLVAISRFEGPARVAFVLVVVVLAPVAEELFFRRHLFVGLLASGRRRTAYLSVALLFALVHLHPPALATYVFYGLGLAWLYERTRWIGTPMVAHAVVNGTATALLLT